MALVQKNLKQRALLIVLAVCCGFMASLVDSIRRYNRLVWDLRVIWYTIIIAVLFFLFRMAFRTYIGLAESGA